jgi:hypothetical protein
MIRRRIDYMKLECWSTGVLITPEALFQRLLRGNSKPGLFGPDSLLYSNKDEITWACSALEIPVGEMKWRGPH